MKWRLSWGVPLFVILLMLVPVASASADNSIAASGSGLRTSETVQLIRSLPNAVIVKVTSTRTFSGTFSGSSTATADCYVNTTNGQGICSGPETFTGTVAGHTGTVEFFDVYKLNGSFAKGSATIIGGTANVHGRVEFQGLAPNFTYTGRLTAQ